MHRWLAAAVAVIALASGVALAQVTSAPFSAPFPQDWGPSTQAGDPAWQAAAVTPSDSADLSFVSTELWVGGAGGVSCVMAHNWFSGMTAAQAQAVAVTFSGITTGQWMPIRCARVMSTNTTATLITEVSR